MKRRSCLLLVAVLATIASAEPPTWRYYQNNAGAVAGSDGRPWRAVPPEDPPAYQPYSTINTGSQQYSTLQSQPAVQGPEGVLSAAPPGSYLPPQTSSSFGQQQQQVQQGPSQYEYQAPQQQSSPGSSAANLGFQIDSARGVLQPSSAVPLPFGGMQSFYFSPKERALYQVMKIMLNPAQFNMIQDAMQKHPDGGFSQGNGYDEPAPVYGPPSATTTTSEAPLEQSSSSALEPERPRESVPAKLLYRNRPKYNFTFSLRTWDGEECEFESEPEPNEGQNPRLRPLPVRSKRGIMRCTPIRGKAGPASKGKDRTVVDDEDKNPLQPFRAPSDLRPIGRERTQVTEEGLESFITVANTNQQPPDNAHHVTHGSQRGPRDSASGGRFPAPGNSLGGNPHQQASQDSYLPARAPVSNYGPPRNQYGPPKVYGPPPKPSYGPPEKLEADEAGSANAARERGNTAGGYELMGGAAGEV